MKPLLYTTLVRGYQSELHRLPKGTYGIALVDQHYRGGANGWHLLRIEDQTLTGCELSRYYKMLPHSVIELAEDDVSVYVDSAFEPRENALELAERLPEGKDLLLLRHPGREFPLQEVHALRHPARQLISQQQVHDILGYWGRKSFDGQQGAQPIGGVIVRRHTQAIRRWGAIWHRMFWDLGAEAGVWRDQLTLALSLRDAAVDPCILDLDYYRSKGWGFRYHTKDREHEMNQHRAEAEESRRRKAHHAEVQASRERKARRAKRESRERKARRAKRAEKRRRMEGK